MENKKKKKLTFLFLLLIIPTLILAQDKPVYEMIGKDISKIAQAYGKPTYHDKSTPEMECIFYKAQTNRYVFVGNKEGVFQAEMCTTLTSEGKAKEVFDKLIAGSITEGFSADTLSAEKINLKRPGTEMDISYFHNTYAKQFEINLKAKKVAD